MIIFLTITKDHRAIEELFFEAVQVSRDVVDGVLSAAVVEPDYETGHARLTANGVVASDFVDGVLRVTIEEGYTLSELEPV